MIEYMKSLVIILTFLGIMSVVVGYVKNTHEPKTQIEYRYIPRTFEQNQENPLKIARMFNDMFSEPTPWMQGIGHKESRRNMEGAAEINRYYISQS